MTDMRHCTRGDHEAPAAEFAPYFDRHGKPRLHSWCSDCKREQDREAKRQKRISERLGGGEG